MLLKRLLAILLLASTAILAGCVSTTEQDPNRVSSLPWNRPQKWEGQGPLGGFTPGTQ